VVVIDDEKAPLRSHDGGLALLFFVVIKDIKKLVADKKIKEATKAISEAYSALDKAAKAGTIKKGAADRKKSRLNAFIKRNV
jgi:ribosomal protein S20